LESAKELIGRYPSPYPGQLAQALAGAYGVPLECIVVGPGSADLIYRLFAFLAPKKTLVVSPNFGEYSYVAERFGKEPPLAFPLLAEQGFALDFQRLLGAAGGVECVVFTHPNNPTGTPVDEEGLERFLEALPASALPPWVVVDEAFVDFCPEASVTGLLGRFSNLVILRSFTKFYAIPGLRVGALLGSARLVHELKALMPPWPMNAIAIEAVLAALEDFDYPFRVRAFTEWMRGLYQGVLGAIPGVVVTPSRANYLLLEIPAVQGRLDAFEATLRTEGVRVRTRLWGLGERFVRVAIKGPDALGALAAGLDRFFKA
jgi:threonine-phosphate decarboxylase